MSDEFVSITESGGVPPAIAPATVSNDETDPLSDSDVAPASGSETWKPGTPTENPNVPTAQWDYTMPQGGAQRLEFPAPPYNFAALEQPFAQPVQPHRPIFNFEGRQFYADAEGNLIPVVGRYAPPPNMMPGIYNGHRYTPQPVIEAAADSFHIGSGGVAQLSGDPMRFAPHGRDLESSGAPIGTFRTPRPITHNMSNRQREREYAKRWRALLQIGAQQVGGLVARAAIGENSFEVNGQPVYTDNIIGGETGLRIIDIADFAAMFEQYKGLRELSLDAVSWSRFDVAYSPGYAPFTKFPKLEVIHFIGSDGRTSSYDRNMAAAKAGLPVDRLTSRVNTWSEFTAQVNRGSNSAFCKPGNRLVMADFTKRMAAGVFGSGGGKSWSAPRRALGVVGMLFGAGATVVTGGVQAARSVRRK
ncbi:hypothetical protein FACS1894208_12030 [Clostridia bacterium]|nr:hypothetical protein FACS1894208_12030 [Clostridia bacterium]